MDCLIKWSRRCKFHALEGFLPAGMEESKKVGDVLTLQCAGVAGGGEFQLDVDMVLKEEEDADIPGVLYISW